MPFQPDMHDRKTTAEISHLSDVVVDFELESEHLEGNLRFYKMRRSQLRPLLLPFSITDRGVMGVVVNCASCRSGVCPPSVRIPIRNRLRHLRGVKSRRRSWDHA